MDERLDTKNIGLRGVKVADTATDAAAGLTKGAGKVVGSVGGGLFKSVKGLAQGDLKGATTGLKQATVGTVTESYAAVTNASGALVEGSAATVSAGTGHEKAADWRGSKASRWSNVWDRACARLREMPYPRAE